MSAAAVAPVARVLYPSGDRYLNVHRSLRLAVGGDFATAAILSALVFLSRGRDRFQCTLREIHEAIEECCAERSIRTKLAKLDQKEFIAVESAEGDQRGDWFQLNTERIQKAIGEHVPRQECKGVTPAKMQGVSISTSKPLKTIAVAASVLEASVGQPESPPVAATADRHRSEHDGVAGSEHCEVEQALLARGVAESVARELAGKNPPDLALRTIMAVDNICRRKTITAGMYVAAMRNPSAYLPPPLRRPTSPPPSAEQLQYAEFDAAYSAAYGVPGVGADWDHISEAWEKWQATGRLE